MTHPVELPKLSDLKCVLFDLDDTLVETSTFVIAAFAARACKMLRPTLSYRQVLRGLSAVQKARGTDTPEVNHTRFLRAFALGAGISEEEAFEILGYKLLEILRPLAKYFKPIEEAQQTLRHITAHCPVVLATNPVLPEDCTHMRLRWAGFSPEEFLTITHSQNMYTCKPNVGYYEAILDGLKLHNITKEQCLFIGNDPKNDAAAVMAGIPTVLLKNGADRLAILEHANGPKACLYQWSWPKLLHHFEKASALLRTQPLS